MRVPDKDWETLVYSRCKPRTLFPVLPYLQNFRGQSSLSRVSLWCPGRGSAFSFSKFFEVLMQASIFRACLWPACDLAVFAHSRRTSSLPCLGLGVSSVLTCSHSASSFILVVCATSSPSDCFLYTFPYNGSPSFIYLQNFILKWKFMALPSVESQDHLSPTMAIRQRTPKCYHFIFHQILLIAKVSGSEACSFW